MRPIRIAIVDDHPVARWGVEHIFEAHPEIRVLCSVASVEELEVATGAGEAAPEVVIVDLYLAGEAPSLAAIERLAARCRVLVMSASGRREDVLAAIRSGADGYLTKQASDDAFLAGVERVAAGQLYLSSQLADMLHADLDLDSALEAGVGAWGGGEQRLAPREEETLRYIARGFTHAQAARRMGVSQTTVETYIKRIRQKLRVGNKADLTRKAIELGKVSAASPPQPPALLADRCDPSD
ncbi:MAG TPA: response regulator transcription factor [Actinomycetota bacterium]